MQYKSDVEALNALSEKYQVLKSEIAKVIVGQDEVVKKILISIFQQRACIACWCSGACKNMMVNTISKSSGLTYSRIQFTPDLMPSDITGTEILDEGRHFKFVRGPVLPTSSWLMKSTVHRLKPSRLCLKPCRSYQ
jgi:MoxR-like ATPase